MESNEALNREAISLVRAHLDVWTETNDEKRLTLARQVYADSLITTVLVFIDGATK